MNKKEIVFRCISIIFCMYAMVQIIMGIIWIIKNYNTVPSFGDTSEYYELSMTLKVDEYRTVFYPFIIKCARFLERKIGLSYFQYIYAGQILISIGSIGYTWDYIFRKILKRKGIVIEIITILFFFTIPMITFHNLCVLPDSLATSLLLIAITQLIKIAREEYSLRELVIFLVSIIFAFMIRADRIYSCSILVALYCVVYVIKTKEVKKYVAVLICLCFAVFINLGINSFTQTKGLYGRIETSFPFVLLDRVVYPHMEENYEYFSQDIKDIITLEDAKVFDSHNNKVFYYLAPMLQEKVGKENAESMYIDMARIVWKYDKKAVVKDTTGKFIVMYFFPMFENSAVRGKVLSNSGWLIYNFSTNDAKLTSSYLKYYDIGFGYIGFFVSFLLVIIGLIITKTRMGVIDVLKSMALYFALLAIIVAWFSLGDGDTPNQRYVLIGFLSWTMLAVGILIKTKAYFMEGNDIE